MQKEGEFQTRIAELEQKYNLNLEKLREEQIKLAKNIEISDKIDFDLADRVAGVDSVFFQNRIISAVVVILNDEIIEQEYFEDKISFPYIPEFRAYRELPSIVSAFNKLAEKPDLVFINGYGILHKRGLGLASHFSLAVDIPSIGIADSLLSGEVRGENILLGGKIVGKVIHTKQGAKPLYISPGNFISVETAAKLIKRFTKEPHKLPEPLRLARRYAKEIRKEIFKVK